MSDDRIRPPGAAQFLRLADEVQLAYRYSPGNRPTVVFLGGFASDMNGTKARHVEAFCIDTGRACLCLDYRGHGQSGGAFTDGSIGRWTQDARSVIESVTSGPLVLVGSSMGGWIMFLLSRSLGRRVAGLLGIAAGPDFTESLEADFLNAEQREELRRCRVVYVDSGYEGRAIAVTQHLIDEGRSHCLLDAPIDVTCPVRLLQGQKDADVPWRTALQIAERVASRDVRVILLKDGDHRLSGARELALLSGTLEELLQCAPVV